MGFFQEIRTNEIKNETYERYECLFQQYETIRSFGESIYTQRASIVDTEKEWKQFIQKYSRI